MGCGRERATSKQGARVEPSHGAGIGGLEQPAWPDSPHLCSRLTVLPSQPSQHWEGSPSSHKQWIEALRGASQAL